MTIRLKIIFVFYEMLDLFADKHFQRESFSYSAGFTSFRCTVDEKCGVQSVLFSAKQGICENNFKEIKKISEKNIDK